MSFRTQYTPIIAEVIRRVGRNDMRILRKELREAFPHPPRQYWPYKVWLDEINRQLGLGKYSEEQMEQTVSESKPKREPLPGQKEMF